MQHQSFRSSPSPGFVLLHDYLVPLCITPTQLGQAIDMPTANLTAMLDGEQATPELCTRLAQYFGTAPNFWIDLQDQRSAQQALR